MNNIPTTKMLDEENQWELRKQELDATIVEPLKVINRNRKELCPSNPYNIIHFEDIDYLEAKLLPCHHLDEPDKNYVLSHFREDEEYSFYHFVRYILNLPAPQADYQPSIKINTPIKTLITWYENRTRKKVQFARNEIMERYKYLDTQDQLIIRLDFLNSLCKRDQEYALNCCLDHWDGSELTSVQNLWKNVSEEEKQDTRWYLASKLLLRHAPIDFIVQQQNKMYSLNDKHNCSLYYFYALRLAKAGSFVPQKQLLYIEDYYRLLYQTGQPILGQEWEEDIYRVVADIYIHNSRFTYLPYSSCNRKEKDFLSAQSRHHDEPNYIYPKNIDIPIQNQRSWNGMQKRKKHLIEVSTIRTMLLYAALAGIKEVQSFVTYANKVDNTINEKYGDKAFSCYDDDAWKTATSYDDLILNHLDKRSIATEELLIQCPQQHKHFFDELIAKHEEIIAKFIKLKEKQDAQSENLLDVTPIKDYPIFEDIDEPPF